MTDKIEIDFFFKYGIIISNFIVIIIIIGVKKFYSS
jgi:hypothetical protein